ETRRRHPSAGSGRVEEGIRRERLLLEPVRARADLVIDTSQMSPVELRDRIAGMFWGERRPRELFVTVTSFGFKYGVPPEADLVFDVRFLPNPFYDPELRPWTGEEPAVRDYVLENAAAQEFLDRLRGLLKFLLPQYASEPKAYLTIAVGCTGGRHRSVAVAHALTVFLRDLKHNVRLRHRDISRPVEEPG
ncbi:MAG TPA: RNase adapter RapZ, partial [Candidatus Hydrogenedentes bacterium]|nr:RNase adapter RapZ [Candidatus Hydrogenedentota bacterium]